jgi:hypothetical protein
VRIDHASGAILSVSGSIDPSTDKTAFFNSALGSKSEQQFVNGSFETYRFLPESGIIATAEFQDGRLLNVSILFGMPDDSEDNVSMERELQRKRKHDDWLRAELGDPPYQYNWGHVSSDFYHQHCESDIMVVYES